MAENFSKKVLIVAGEASGDLHAGNLIRTVKEHFPHIDFFGLGGKVMREAGARITHDLRSVSVIGLVEVLGRLPTIWRTMRELVALSKETRPDLAVLVDFPDFNLRLAAKLKQAGIPILWYISPQVWAWRAERLTKIRELIDYMMVILPFEVDFYQQHQLHVHFVGHPLIDTIKPLLTPTDAYQNFQLRAEDPVIALLPGSRNVELKLLLPHLKAAAELLYQRDRRRQFLLPIANTIDPQRVKKILGECSAPIKLIIGQAYDCLAIAQAAVVAAGTATLETALIGTPEIIVGRVSPLTWKIWSRYTNLPFYGLPNYILGEKLITELIQHQANGEQIANEIEKLLASPLERERLQNGYQIIRDRLGVGGASQQAAKVLIDILAGKGEPYLLKQFSSP